MNSSCARARALAIEIGQDAMVTVVAEAALAVCYALLSMERVKHKQPGAKRQRGYTRVSPKHQVTLPADVLAKAGLRVGDRLQVAARGTGEVVLIRETDAVETYAGALHGMYPVGHLDSLRDEWD
jgi:bifunctional DNA-binding transcriptional regulator/antitoxin component of YhaV-PrlF toxin-antitoxin module